MSTLLFLCGLFLFPTANAQDSPPCDENTCNYTVQLEKAGFYIAVVTLPPGQQAGIWSLVINPKQRGPLYGGGFFAGATLKENASFGSWIGFSLANTEAVQIKPTDYTGINLPLTVKLQHGNNAPIYGPLQMTPGETYTTLPLDPGFYVTSILNQPNAPDTFFGLELLASSIYGGVIGGWLDSKTGPGYAAFSVSYPQTLRFELMFDDSYGAGGAGQPHLEVYYQKADGTRELVWSAPKSTSTTDMLTGEQPEDEQATEKGEQTLPNLVHPQKGNAVLISADAKQTWNTPTQFSGGVSSANGDFVASGIATHFQSVSVKAKIQVQPEHVGQSADLLFMVGMATPPAPYGEGEETIYSSVSSSNDFYPLGLRVPADQQQPVSMSVPVVGWEPDRISAFAHGVTLQSSTSMELRLDKLTEPGMYYFFPAYRLNSGDIVYSPMPIKLEVQAGEQPYFPGVVQIVATDVDKASLAWLPATDNKTPAEAIKYEVHLSDQPNFEPTPKTLHSSVTGASQIDLSGLTAATSYNLLVVAVDADGNRSKERDYRIAKTFTKPVIASSTTKSYVDTNIGLGTATTQDGVNFTYANAGTVTPEIGSVLFSTVGKDIYLRKVAGVTPTGNGIVINTTDALLSEVIEQGSITNSVKLIDINKIDKSYSTQRLKDSGITRRSTRSDEITDEQSLFYDWKKGSVGASQKTTYPSGKAIKVSVSAGNLNVNPTIDFTPEFVTDVSWTDGQQIEKGELLARGTLNLSVDTQFDFTGAVETSQKFKLGELTYTTWYPLGPALILQEVKLALKAEVSFGVEGKIKTSTHVEAKDVLEMGVHYNLTTKNWEPTLSNNISKSFTADVSDPEGKVNAKIKIVPELSVMFYDLLTGTFSIEPYIEGKIAYAEVPKAELLKGRYKTTYQPTTFDAAFGAEFFVKVDFGKRFFFGFNVFSAKICDQPLLPACPKLWLFTLPKLELDDANGEVNEPITLNATVLDNGSKSEGDNKEYGVNNPFNDGLIKWDVFPDKGSASGSRTGTFTASEEGTYTVFFSGHSRLPDPFGRQFAMADVTVGPEKEKPKKPDGPKASTNGDPHLYTFDNLAYDFQAEGEFILAKSTVLNDNFEVQVRQSPPTPNKEQTGVAVTKGAAMNIAGDKVSFYLKQKPVSHINGIPQELPDGSITPLPQGGKIFRQGSLYSMVWPNGGELVEVRDNNYGFLVSTYISMAQKGKMIGLLGNGDDDRGNDLVMRDGTPLGTKISFDMLYPNYANSWRITQQESLFDYAPGETTETFTDRNFPRVLSKANGLTAEQRARAEQVCVAAGITDQILLDDCILDVGVTGEDGFAEVPSNLATPKESAYIAHPEPPTLGMPGFGQLKGLVYDGITKQVINGARVKLTVDGIALPGTTVKTTTNGLYETDVVPKGYDGYLLEIEADGYIPERVLSVTVPDGQAEEVKAVNLVPTALQGMGKISGVARNAVDNTVIPNLTVNALRYIDAWGGEVVKTAQTDQNGVFNLEGLEAGNYTLMFNLTLEEPYVTSYFNHQVTALSIGGQVTNTEVSITPYRDVDLNGAMFRIILKWNNVPYDLDGHLTGPTDENGRFHIHFANPYFNGARLDRDDRDGTGPEMITIDSMPSGGVYRFSVHDYKSGGLTSSDTLAKSGAKVDVYSQNGLVSFNVPSQEGTLWTVFEIDEFGTVVPVNTMGYEVNQGGIRSSTGIRSRRGSDAILQDPVATDYWPIVFQGSKP